MNPIIARIEADAMLAAQKAFSTTAMLPFPKRVEAAIAAYELAMIRPIAEAPRDGTPILTLDTSIRGCFWCQDHWDETSPPGLQWNVCPDSSPSHFRPLPPVALFCPTITQKAS